MPDENDIVFDTYNFDPISPLIDWLAGAADNSDGLSGFWAMLLNLWQIWSIIAFLLSILFIIGIIYSYIRFNQLMEIETNQLLEAEREWQRRYGQADGNGQWAGITAHVASDQPNDWKLAVIEADIMLDRVLSEAGYAGNSVGEKLKSTSPQNFTTIQDAWDAHIIRNKIAHEGSDFVVTHRIAKEAITKYERVFREFGVL